MSSSAPLSFPFDDIFRGFFRPGHGSRSCSFSWPRGTGLCDGAVGHSLQPWRWALGVLQIFCNQKDATVNKLVQMRFPGFARAYLGQSPGEVGLLGQ